MPRVHARGQYHHLIHTHRLPREAAQEGRKARDRGSQQIQYTNRRGTVRGRYNIEARRCLVRRDEPGTDVPAIGLRVTLPVR
jgi:hypothetical protein